MQIQADNHGHRDQGFRHPGVPTVTLLMMVMATEQLGLERIEREKTCSTITMYEWILRCSEAESFGLGVKAENLLENILLH